VFALVNAEALDVKQNVSAAQSHHFPKARASTE
jgi:hypothetical protein